MTDAPVVPHARPFRLDLDQQKTRAKELLRAVRAGDPEAVARWCVHRPVPDVAVPPRLADAQLVLARELGCASWPRLKAHVAAMERARAAMGAPFPHLDADMPTLHLRCGSDIRDRLVEAGFAGDFLEHSDPVCLGPVPEGPGLPAVRARFLAGAFGESMGLAEPAALDRLEREDAALSAAAGRYRRVVAWCEHDSYDQLCLARWLDRFATGGPPPVLELISVDRFPGGLRFIGLGQLPPEALRLLWPTRRRLGPAELETGRRVWRALRADDPRALASLARTAMPGLPDLPGALTRHLQELPWSGDGLSLTERIALRLADTGADGTADPATLGTMFSRLMRQLDPRPWLGDLMSLAILRAMARAAEPPFRLDGEGTDRPWPQWSPRLTAAGRAVLEGRRDHLSLRPPGRWVGGVRIAAGEPHWRWDDGGAVPVRA